MNKVISYLTLTSIAATAAAQVGKPSNLASSLPGSGVSPISANLSPIPLYPATGVIPQSLASNFLFLDPSTRELVISYPDNVDSSNYLQSPGPRQEMRVHLKRDVNAKVYVAFGKDASGRNVYTYGLLNDAGAKQDIGSFALSIPSPGSNLPVRAIDASSIAQYAPIMVNTVGWVPLVSAPDKGLVHMQWSQPGFVGIQPGATLNGFSLASGLKPGFVLATVRSISADPELSQIQAPTRVQTALRNLENSGYNQQTVLTLGPQFLPTINTLTIAMNFLEGLSMLRQHGYVAGNSPFVTESIAVLTQYVDGAKYAADDPASDYTGPALVLKQQPAAGFESQIYEAMKISLGIQ